MPRSLSTDRASFWRRSRGWPVAGQIGFAVVIGLVVAASVGAISNRSSSRSAESTSSSTSATSTTARAPSPQSTGSHSSVPTTLAVSPDTRLVPLAIEPRSHQDTYSRTIDFGGWIDVHGCQNTRATLLIRTSQVPVSFTTSSLCIVKTGRWVDPWSGVATTNAHDFQIDHTVPLANAWSSGAWAWTHEQRVAYANDLTDADHLVPILARANEAKGDGGPDRWRPPSRSAWCRYALDWDHIKAKWHLTATSVEWTALQEMSATC